MDYVDKPSFYLAPENDGANLDFFLLSVDQKPAAKYKILSDKVQLGLPSE